MTVQELHDALSALLPDKADEPICLECYGCHEVESVSVVVHSDLWVPDTVVLTVKALEEVEAE